MERKRLPRGRRRELLSKCGDSVRPLTQKQIDWIRKDTAKYIFFKDKDATKGYCDRCEHEVTFKYKTRHKATVKCPRCHHEMTVLHNWRITWIDEVDFRVIVQVVDENKILYRYVLVNDYTNAEKKRKTVIREVARELDDYEYQRSFYYEQQDEHWVEGRGQQWFLAITMNWRWRRYCCLNGKVYKPGLKAELKKVKALEHIENPTLFIDDKMYVSSCVRELICHADLYEKLIKAGHTKFAVREFRTWLNYFGSRSSYSLYDESQTALYKILGFDNKGTYKRWKKYETMNVLRYLQKYPNIKEAILEYVNTNDIDIYTYESILNLKIGHELKTLKYLTENKINKYEYGHYIGLLKELGYALDKAYLYPKDFRKEDDRIAEEYEKRLEEIEQQRRNKNSELIKGISDGLRRMEDLQEFMNGSNGLLVYVPESVEDLEQEGKRLHCCLGTYAERVAKGDTLIFFVRRMNAPDDPFVAFEYWNGEVLQCRYDHNDEVKDKKIINFVEAIAERLRKNNILYKAA